MLALTGPVLALPSLAAILVGRGLPPRAVLITAVVLLFLGNALLSRIQPGIGTSFIVASLLLIGAANGILTGLIDPQTLAQVPRHRLGMASGLINTVRAGGNTVTLALFAALLITQLQSRLGDRSLAARIAAGDLTDPGQIDPYSEALQGTLLIVAAACAVLGAAAVLLTRPGHQPIHPSTLTTDRRTAMTTDIAETAVLHYTVKSESLDQHLELLSDVYSELDAVRPSSFSWATFQVPGCRDFIEIATGHPLPGPLPDLPAFRLYRAGLDDRCETRQFDYVTVIGSFASA